MTAGRCVKCGCNENHRYDNGLCESCEYYRRSKLKFEEDIKKDHEKIYKEMREDK